MKARTQSLNVDSSSSWGYLALEDSNDRPRLISFCNIGSVPIFIKWMNVNEGNGDSEDKFYLPAGVSVTIELEDQELPVTRVGGLLFSGSTASTLIVSASNFQSES